MSRYQKQIALQSAGQGFTLTLTETVGDNDPIVTVLDFATAAELKTYTDAQLDKALAEQVLFETLSNRAKGEERAWFAALNGVNENDYFDRKRPKIKEWVDGYDFRYLNSDGVGPVDCTINASGFVRGKDPVRNYLRVVFDSTRRIGARLVGSQDEFLMLSADEQWWVGTDADGVTHRLRRIQKTD